MITPEINKWAMKVCGVTQFASYYRYANNKEVRGKFTLEDARCMEIFRSVFKIKTEYMNDNSPDLYFAGTYEYSGYWITGRGQSIPEAEQAVAVAIYKAEQGAL